MVLEQLLVRIDPDTTEATLVVPIGDAADLVVVSGGYVCVTHHVLRDTDGIGGLDNAGERILTPVDRRRENRGRGPCAMPARPRSVRDVWVANCYLAASGADPDASVVRVDADTLAFEATWPVPGGDGFFRGLAYVGGWLASL